VRSWLLALSLVLTPARAADWPDIDEPARTGATAASDAAVVIGNEDYFKLPDVPYARRDAAAFFHFLLYTRGVPPQNIHRLDDADPAMIRAALSEAASRARPGGTVWVYYAGHGAADPSTGERLLLGAAARSDPASFAAGAIPVAEVERLASGGAGSAALVLDACYNGLGRGGDQYGDKRFAVPAHRPGASASAWMAAGPDEVSGTIPQVQHGAFT